MSNDQTAAVAALRDFLSAMRDWESNFYGRYRSSLSDAGAAKLIGVEMCNAKRAIIARWCSPEVLARASASPSVGDPPRFDPDRDVLNIQDASDSEVVVEHIQRARLESQHRFRMRLKGGRWVVEEVEILEDDLPNWSPMIL